MFKNHHSILAEVFSQKEGSTCMWPYIDTQFPPNTHAPSERSRYNWKQRLTASSQRTVETCTSVLSISVFFNLHWSKSINSSVASFICWNAQTNTHML